MWVTPVTNRSATYSKTNEELKTSDGVLIYSADAKFLMMWIEANKPYLNYADLNRIELDCVYLVEKFNVNLIPVTIITKTDWAMNDFPYLTEIKRIRDNINALKNAFYIMTGSPVIAYWNSLNWTDANSLEQNLLNLKTLLDLMTTSFRYSGTFSAGQEVIL